MTFRNAFLRFAGPTLPVVAVLLAASGAWAQAPGVGIGTTTPNAAAVLDLTSTTQGLLLPRLSQAQRDALGTGSLAAPVAGLVIYQTDNAPGLYAYDGTAWVPLRPDNLGNHSATQNLALNSANNLLLRAATDPNHGLGYYGYTDSGPKLWAGTDEADGPVLFGYGGGRLGTTRAGQQSALAWKTDVGGISRVGIGTSAPNQTLDVRGNTNVDGSLYLTNSNVLETGAGILTKEYNAGKIGYHFLSADALDITGAGDGSYTTRKINFYTEGGANLFGALHLTGNLRADGRVAQQSFDPGSSGVGAASGLTISSGTVTVPAGAGGSFTWTHGLGYAPIVVGSLDQTGGGFADYVQWTYSNDGSTSTTFYFTNRSGSDASFRLHWLVVN